MDDKHSKIESVENSRIRRDILLLSVAWVILWAVNQYIFTDPSSLSTSAPNYAGWKVLYVVTTLSEYDSGSRSTVKGYDRLRETVIPVVRESVESMLRKGFDVDVVMICHFEMTREHLVREALPPSVGLQVWDSATPMGYKLEDKQHNYTQDVTRALARQHRYVIKDKFKHYDLFANFEDDMLISGESIEYYIQVTQELYRLRSLAPDEPPTHNFKGFPYYGTMSKAQLQRLMPGFIRVEVLLDEAKYGTQEQLDPVPVTDRPQLDPRPCCHLENPLSPNSNRPKNPDSDQMFLWETHIQALGVRKLPLHAKGMDWLLMQRGPRVMEANLTTADYWAGSDGYFRNMEDPKDRNRPDTKAFKHINNMGGWMATRHQIWEWHTQVCPGGFLPPYESPEYNLDGLDMRNVEYWSGGMSLVTKEHGCNLQRIIPLDEKMFARSLLYHTANNKQRQFAGKKHVMVKVNDLFGQLNTVRKNAQADMQRRLSAINDVLHHV